MRDRFSLLFVCTGNRFRSPLASALVGCLTESLPVDVGSAGTIDLEGVPALVEACTLGAALGVDLSAHRSRRLSPSQIAWADLVLGFEQIHRRHAIVYAAADHDKTFTLGELVRLLRHVPDPTDESLPERARARVRAADRLRAGDPEDGGRADEVADPFGRKRKVYRQTASRIHELSLELVRGLFELER